MKDLNKLVFDAGIMPILLVDEVGCAQRVVSAIEQTDIPVVEILQRNDAALEVFQEAVKVKKHALIGAGTVCTLEHCKKMVDLGADFIVSPGYNPEMVDWCVRNSVPVIPGVSNPSEVMLAANAGLEVVKFFPFNELGGEVFLNAISGPFPKMKFVITGCIDDRELHYLSNHKIAAIGGVWPFQSETDHTVISAQQIRYRMERSLELARHYRKGWD